MPSGGPVPFAESPIKLGLNLLQDGLLRGRKSDGARLYGEPVGTVTPGGVATFLAVIVVGLCVASCVSVVDAGHRGFLSFDERTCTRCKLYGKRKLALDAILFAVLAAGLRGYD
jgi:hypothetical protein